MWGDEVLRASYILVPAIQSSFLVEFVVFESLPLCFLLLNMSGVVTTVKRRRLAELAGTRFVSESALSQLLSRLGVTGATSRQSIHRHVEADAAFLVATIDVPCKDGSVFRWKVVDPVALINWLCKYSSRFADALENVHACHLCSLTAPWSVMAYVTKRRHAIYSASIRLEKVIFGIGSFKNLALRFYRRMTRGFMAGYFEARSLKR